MLIEFSVTNFRSFKDRQSLSLVANNQDHDHTDSLISLKEIGLDNVNLIKSAVVYGANAAGKSNLFKAARFMREFVLDSAENAKSRMETGTAPFRLDMGYANAPSEFEIIFIHEGIRYQYGFVLDRKAVHKEWLYVFPKGEPENWFLRLWNADVRKYAWQFGEELKGDPTRLKGITPWNVLFLSNAAKENHPQLTKVYEWFLNSFQFIDCSSEDFDPQYTISMMNSDPILKKTIGDLMKQADARITGIDIETHAASEMELPADYPEEAKQELLEEFQGMEVLNFQMRHRSTDPKTDIAFDREEESSGTLKYFSLLGPWLDYLTNGVTIFVDEIDANMHPLLTRYLIQIINLPSNDEGAQLLFTTRDSALIDMSQFRRDQVWFAERNRGGATVIYPLTHYKSSKTKPKEKDFIEGRFGLIPFLKSEFPF